MLFNVINSGISQGCVSSPIIFAMFVNDLISYLRSESGRVVFVTDGIEDILA